MALLATCFALPYALVQPIFGPIGDHFGKDRVIDTPISESAIVGAAGGLALAGKKPIAELMFADFIGVSLDQMLVALQRANPNAFVNGNVHRLRSGVVLNLRTGDEVAAAVAAMRRDLAAHGFLDAQHNNPQRRLEILGGVNFLDDLAQRIEHGSGSNSVVSRALKGAGQAL